MLQGREGDNGSTRRKNRPGVEQKRGSGCVSPKMYTMRVTVANINNFFYCAQKYKQLKANASSTDSDERCEKKLFLCFHLGPLQEQP